MKTTVSASVDLEVAQLLEKQVKNRSKYINNLLRRELMKTTKEPQEQKKTDQIEEEIIKQANKLDEYAYLKNDKYWASIAQTRQDLKNGKTLDNIKHTIKFNSDNLGVSIEEYLKDVEADDQANQTD